MIDMESARAQLASSLPVYARWSVRGDALDFDFSRSNAPLRNLTHGDLGCCPGDEMRSLYIFGEEHFADGGGATSFLAIHGTMGTVLGIDPERDTSQLYFLNSNVHAFIR